MADQSILTESSSGDLVDVEDLKHLGTIYFIFRTETEQLADQCFSMMSSRYEEYSDSMTMVYLPPTASADELAEVHVELWTADDGRKTIIDMSYGVSLDDYGQLIGDINLKKADTYDIINWAGEVGGQSRVATDDLPICIVPHPVFYTVSPRAALLLHKIYSDGKGTGLISAEAFKRAYTTVSMRIGSRGSWIVKCPYIDDAHFQFSKDGPRMIAKGSWTNGQMPTVTLFTLFSKEVNSSLPLLLHGFNIQVYLNLSWVIVYIGDQADSPREVLQEMLDEGKVKLIELKAGTTLQAAFKEGVEHVVGEIICVHSPLTLHNKSSVAVRVAALLEYEPQGKLMSGCASVVVADIAKAPFEYWLRATAGRTMLDIASLTFRRQVAGMLTFDDDYLVPLPTRQLISVPSSLCFSAVGRPVAGLSCTTPHPPDHSAWCTSFSGDYDKYLKLLNPVMHKLIAD